MMNKWRVIWMITALWMATGVARCAEPILIVKPDSNVQQKSGQTLDFAAEELSHYLKAITGRDYPVASGTDRCASAAVRLIVDPSYDEDEYSIRRTGAAVEISGGSPRGCLFGAYGLLHALGCRWPLAGKAYEVVPHRAEIDWSGPDIHTRPAMKHRGLLWIPGAPAGYDDLVDIIDYSAKNGLNFMLIHVPPIPPNMVAKLNQAVRQRDFGIEWGGHFLPSYLPRSEFDKHPDYFRMENGKRTASLNMCPSSPEAAAIIAKNSLADWQRLQVLPRLEMVHMWPDDLGSGGWCSCPKCAGLSDSDQALKILNAVAERLPLGETALAHLSYHATAPKPEKIKPHPNVRLFYAPRERCYRHAIGECEANRRYLDWLKAQVAWFPNQPEVLEYHLDHILFRQMPMPLHTVIGRDVKAYREAGIGRIADHAMNRASELSYGPNFYVYAKAMWRGDGSPDDIKEYCQAMYGPAAEAMEQYFDRVFVLCATAMETCGYKGCADLRYSPLDEPFTATRETHLAPLVAKEHLDEIEGIITRARLTAPEEPYRSRIDQQMVLWQIARLETRAMYNDMVVMRRMKNFHAGRMSQSDRQQTIALAQESVANIEKVGDLLLSLPASARGPLVTDKNFYDNERSIRFPAQSKAWLKELESSKK